MNISEFERTKPTGTNYAINSCIDKYSGYIAQIDPIMDEGDQAMIEAYTEILEDLKQIKVKFLRGA